MQNRKIISLTLAIFSISVLLMLAFITNPNNMAFALKSWTVTLAGNVSSGTTDYVSNDDVFVGTRVVTSTDMRVVKLNPTTNATSESANIGVPTNAGSYVGIIKCSPSNCYSIWDQVTGSAGTDQYIRFTSSGSLSSTSVALRDIATSTVERIADTSGFFLTGSTFFGAVQCSTGDTDVIVITLNSNLDTITGELMDCAGTNLGAGNIVDMYIFGTKMAITESDRFSLWNTGGGFICSLTQIFSGTNGDIARGNGNWLVTTGTDVLNISDSCVLLDTITTANMNLANPATSLKADVSRGEYYACDNIECAVMSTSDTDARLYKFSLANGDKYFVAHADEFNVVAGFSGTTATLVDLDDTASGGSGSTACIDTNLDGVTDLCFTDTNGDGVADNGFAGGLGAFSSNANITDIGTDWFCAFKLGNACNNPNVKTNGVGVFYLIIIVIFSYAILVAIHIKAVESSSHSNVQLTDALRINPILLVVMLMVDVAFAWYLNFIENTIFYSVIAILVGLAGFGVYKQVKGES